MVGPDCLYNFDLCACLKIETRAFQFSTTTILDRCVLQATRSHRNITRFLWVMSVYRYSKEAI